MKKQQRKPATDTALFRATAYLFAVLVESPAPGKVCIAKMRTLGIGRTTTLHAFAILGVLQRQIDGVWHWVLPPDTRLRTRLNEVKRLRTAAVHVARARTARRFGGTYIARPYAPRASRAEGGRV